MIRTARLGLALALLTIGVVAGPAHAVAYSQIEGSGSTWSQVILQQWISDVSSSGIRVTYNGNGSSQGRKDFANNVTDFGVSEIPYQGTDPVTHQADNSNGRDFAYLPIVAGGTSFTYQLKIGGKQVRNLRLSGDTIAKIFTNKITSWDDPQITKDMNGQKLPKLPITPVVRSDGSGTTAQFTRWLDTQYPSIWRPYNGHAGLTSQYPRKGRQIGASGSDQVMNTITGKAGNGTIGYVEYSYPQGAHYPVVKVENKAGYFVEPTKFNVAVALTKAKINQVKSSQEYLTQILNGVYNDTDKRTYPLSSYSYLIVPTGADDRRMTTGKRQALADFLFYGLCQGQSKAGDYGYSPLPLNLVSAGFQQVAKLKKADPKVDLKNRSVDSCNNPTFVKGDLHRNHLAEIAPMPAACDKRGAGPCGGGTGTGTPSTDKNQKQQTAKGAASAGSAAAASGGGAAGTTDVTAADAGSAVSGVPVEVSDKNPADDLIFGWVTVLELLGLLLLPGVYVAYRRRTGGATR